MWNEKSELLDGSHSVSNIHDYFEHIIKIHEKVTNSIPIRIYANKLENTITFKIKRGHYFKLLRTETMKILGRSKSKIIKDKNGKNVLHLEIIEVVLVHCNVVNNDYQRGSGVLNCQ